MSYVNPTAGTGVDAMAQQLMQVFDRNKDGQLTTAEFTAVLGDILGNRATTAGAAETAGTRRTDHLAGFSPAKFDSSQSIKYKFARAAMQFDLASVKDKPSAEALLNQMKPAMAREGLEVLEVNNDKIRVMYEGNPLWVDVIQGSSGGSPLFQWLPIE